MTDPKPITPEEITNTKHMLDLLRKQILSRHVETDYAVRQIEKVQGLLARIGEQSQNKEAEGRFEVLYNVTRMLGSSLELQTVLDQVMDAIIKLVGAERGFLMLRNDDGELTVQAARNLDQETLDSSNFEYSRTISNHVIDSGESILTTNALEDPRFKGQVSVVTQSLRSIMAAPLWARGKIIGIAYVENRVVAGLFKQSDLAILEALVGQASIAIDNALLFEETDDALTKRIDELRELRRIDKQLNAKLDPDEAMQYTLERACRISNATEGHLGLIQKGSKRIEATHHFDNNALNTTREVPIYLNDAYPQAWDAIEKHQSITYDTGQYGVITVLIVPLIREKEAIGVLILLREDGNTFTPEQQDFVERIMARAVITIENARLYAAVQAADKAKTEFVGIVAHDLKAPMTSIRGYADLILYQNEGLSERETKFLNRISNTVNRMEMLVSDLADISRIESGQFLMNPMVLKVRTVTDAVRDTIMPQMEERKHTYVEDVEKDLPNLWVDYYRLLQVLTNLLSNAYKYTPDGGTITLKISKKNDRVRFSVSDTGIGLSKENLSLIGTKFWRAEDEFTRSQPGTGLGFSITRALIVQMGSQLKIKSKEGEGSTFSFSVAIATQQE